MRSCASTSRRLNYVGRSRRRTKDLWSAKGRTPYIRPASTEGWIDALLVAAGTSLLGVFRLGLVGRLPSMWVELMERVPRFIRYALALIFGILPAYRLLHWLCS